MKSSAQIWTICLAVVMLLSLASCDRAAMWKDSKADSATHTPGTVVRGVGTPDLTEVRHWLYLIDVDLDAEMATQIASSAYDMVVLDYIPSDRENANYPMAEVVAQLHQASRPKLVLAYVDIGEAEDYRTYWQPGWHVGEPAWIAGGDPDGWEGNYPVAYWDEGWRTIWLGEDGLLGQIVEARFDGVYLDWVEGYSDAHVVALAGRDGVDPGEEMIRWVGDIAAFGRARHPGFLVIAQNAAELAESDRYLTSIDAIAQEQVWYDGGAGNKPPGDCPLPRTEADLDSDAYRKSLSRACRRIYDRYPDSTLHTSSEAYLYYLILARNKGVPVFTVDYALAPENVAWIYETSRALGFVPFASSRALDRYLDPVP